MGGLVGALALDDDGGILQRDGRYRDRDETRSWLVRNPAKAHSAQRVGGYRRHEFVKGGILKVRLANCITAHRVFDSTMIDPPDSMLVMHGACSVESIDQHFAEARRPIGNSERLRTDRG